MATLLGEITVNQVSVAEMSGNPIATGLDLPKGSLALDVATGTVYSKIGATNTDWQAVGTASTYASLTDVVLTALANGDTTRYDTVTSKWINSKEIRNASTVSIEPTATLTNNPYTVVVDGAGSNLVPNPSFENNITDSWSNTGVSVNTRDTTEKWIGSASLKIVSSAAAAGLKSSVIAISSNTQYVFSCYVKGIVGGERFNLTIDPNVSAPVDSSNQGGFSSVTIKDLVNTDWSRITMAWTSGASDTSVELYLRSDTATAQTVYVDAVQFEQKTWPTSSEESVFASTFINGSLGIGYNWVGTANNSASTRTAGAKFLSSISGIRGNFAIRSDGTIARATFDAAEIQSADFQGTRNEPFFPFSFLGKMKTNVITSGISAGVMLVKNLANGVALQVESAATTAEGMIISFASLTSGVGLAIFAPSDLSAMQAAGGRFFSFAGKALNSELYVWFVDKVVMGAIGFKFQKNINILGGGSMTSTARVLAGTVSVTASNTLVTGAGTSFITDFVRGQAIRINNGGATTIIHTIASIASNTSLTLTVGWTGTTSASRTYDSFTTQYAPPVIHLEGNYGNHGSSGSVTGDFMYGLYPSGSNGHMHVMKSAVRGVAVTPSADNIGDGLVTTRRVDSTDRILLLTAAEVDIITGYTIPAQELQNGTVFRIKLSGTTAANAVATTVTFRVKIGGTTILTSVAHQLGSTQNGMPFKGEIEIVGLSDTSQRASLSFAGKDTTVVTGADTWSTCRYQTSAIDMRVDRTLTVTAQTSDALSAVSVLFSTVEIL